MVWAWDAIVVLGIAHFAFSAPSTFEDASSIVLSQEDVDHLPFSGKEIVAHVPLLPYPEKRSTIKRLDVPGDHIRDSFNSGFVANPIHYPLQEELRPYDPNYRFLSKSSNSANDALYRDLQIDPPSEREISRNEPSITRSDSLERSAERDYPNNLDPIWLRKKRLQMKTSGLFGSFKNKNILGGKNSLMSYGGSKNKGLVLSIDLGIKALRDAILHAKVQQKNRKLQAQAQKNMRLLHNIGKRRALTISQNPTSQ